MQLTAAGSALSCSVRCLACLWLLHAPIGWMKPVMDLCSSTQTVNNNFVGLQVWLAPGLLTANGAPGWRTHQAHCK